MMMVELRTYCGLDDSPLHEHAADCYQGRAPATAAGRALDEWQRSDMRPISEFGLRSVHDAILAIEAEAAARPDAAALADYLREVGDYEADTATFVFDGNANPEGFAAAILARLPAAPDAAALAEALEASGLTVHELLNDKPVTWAEAGKRMHRFLLARAAPAAAEGPEPDVSFDSVAERHIREGTLTLPEREAEAAARPDVAALDEFERRYDVEMRKGSGMPGETRVRRMIAEARAAEYARLPAAPAEPLRPDAPATAALPRLTLLRSVMRGIAYDGTVDTIEAARAVAVEAINDDEDLARLPAAPAEPNDDQRWWHEEHVRLRYYRDGCPYCERDGVPAAAEGDDRWSGDPDV